MQAYLSSSVYIDCENSAIRSLAQELAAGLTDDSDIAKRCFEWVRDHIKHSSDYQLNPVTCIASDVLQHRTGYCYAKSHLLAALLRANALPAGLCYQRLSVDGEGAPYCLHGLNAVYLKQYGWYRIDARGNFGEINAQFTPPQEQLAFSTLLRQEADLFEIWPEPLPLVVSTLEKYASYEQVYENLPDIEVIQQV